MVVQIAHNAVILSERSESKDLRISFTFAVKLVPRSLGYARDDRIFFFRTLYHPTGNTHWCGSTQASPGGEAVARSVTDVVCGTAFDYLLHFGENALLEHHIRPQCAHWRHLLLKEKAFLRHRYLVPFN